VVRGLRCSGAPNADVPLQPGRVANPVRSGCLPSIATARTFAGSEPAMSVDFSELFMAKEAVASWNIEHPDKPMTLTEYFIGLIAPDSAPHSQPEEER
jgi:hypothetical protein